jgi:hypothetical protein
LRGNLPSKKNTRSASGHYPKNVSETLRDLELQARVGWRDSRGPLPPVVDPDITFQLFIKNPSKDRDGIITTLLDVLVKARVLPDDSIRKYNGREVIEPVILVDSIRDERAAVQIVFEL